MANKIVPPKKPNNVKVEGKENIDEKNDSQARSETAEKLEAARLQEIEALYKSVNNSLSLNSEKFLRDLKQPGGE